MDSNWKDISTAPKDGTEFLLLSISKDAAGEYKCKFYAVAFYEAHDRGGGHTLRGTTGEGIESWIYLDDSQSYWQELPE